MRLLVLIISLIITPVLYAQKRDVISIKLKKMDIPPVTTPYFFFSSDNLVWFSTRQGLTSFDGIETIYYCAGENESYKNELANIRAIAEDKDKSLWIATNGSGLQKAGLFHFNRVTKIIHKIWNENEKNSSGNISFVRMFLDDKGLLWMSTVVCGFYIYNTVDNSMEHYSGTDQPLDCNVDGPPKYNYQVPDFSRPGKMWVGSHEGIFLFDRGTKKIEKKLAFEKPANSYESSGVIYMDVRNDSIIYIGIKHHGLGIYNTKRNILEMIPQPSSLSNRDIISYNSSGVISIDKKSEDECYVTYYDSLPAIFNWKTKRYSFLTDPEQISVSKKGFIKIQIDKAGNQWICQWKNLYVVNTAINLFNSRDNPILPFKQFGETRLLYLIWDKELKCYYATFESSGNVYRLDSNFNYINTISTPFKIWSGSEIKIIQDNQKRIWALNISQDPHDNMSLSNVCVYTKESGSFQLVQKAFPQLNIIGDIYDIAADNMGNIIFSKINGDIFLLNTKTVRLNTIPSPPIKAVSNNFSSALYYDSNHGYVYSSKSGNLIQYDIKLKTGRVFRPADSTLLYKTKSFYFDDVGQIWVINYTPNDAPIHIYDAVTFEYKRELVLRNTQGEKLAVETLCPGPPDFMIIILRDYGLAVYDYMYDNFKLIDKGNGLLGELPRRTIYVNNKLISGHGNKIQFVSFDKIISQKNERIPQINQVTVYEGKRAVTLFNNNDRIKLDYKRNTIGISFSALEYIFPERVQYAFRLTEIDDDWKFVGHKDRKIIYSNLHPGKYIFQLKAQILGGNWQSRPLEYIIIITPPFWKTWWFRTMVAISALGILYLLYRRRVALIRRKDQVKTLHEKELLELEAKALRAQMNPHFIFNSLNSIKSLINKNENDKAAGYLTTFSKLIRTLFQNSDKREVSLHEELETCRLYTQLEKMRFGDKVNFIFDVDEKIDLKDIKVPALFLQPFIENAIWHGLVPKKSGGQVTVGVKESKDAVECIIDDDGVGRELSRQYKAQYEAIHQSKGIGLTQSRLELDKLLNEREATIHIIDKKNAEGMADGTRVIITFKENKN